MSVKSFNAPRTEILQNPSMCKFEAARGALDETYKRVWSYRSNMWHSQMQRAERQVTEHVNPTSWAVDPKGSWAPRGVRADRRCAPIEEYH